MTAYEVLNGAAPVDGSIRVVVCDDDPEVREALADLLEADPRFTVAAQAADGRGLAELVSLVEADVVLLDVRMPSGGARAAAALQSAAGVTLVAVSAETSPGVVADLLRSGVRGFMAKGRLGPELPDLVERCHHGEVVLAVPTAAEAVRRLVHGQ